MKFDELNELLESALENMDNLEIEDSVPQQVIDRAELDFKSTLDTHQDFMLEAVGGDPDNATFGQKKAVFDVMTALHDILLVEEQIGMPN